MNKYLKIGIIFAVLLVTTLLVDFFLTQNSPSQTTSMFEPRQPQYPFENTNMERYYSYVADIELYYRVKTILSTINATLLVILLATYVGMYKKLKSDFTIGLILFSIILLLYALSSNPLLQWVFGFRAFGLGPFAMLPDLFTTIALCILLYLTMR